MHSFIRNDKDRRKYSQRTKFDFAKYKEARKIQTSLRLGYKARRFSTVPTVVSVTCDS